MRYLNQRAGREPIGVTMGGSVFEISVYGEDKTEIYSVFYVDLTDYLVYNNMAYSVDREL